MARGHRSVSALAKHCGIGVGTMANYLIGGTEPPLSALRKMAEALNLSIGWLVGDEVTTKEYSFLATGDVCVPRQLYISPQKHLSEHYRQEQVILPNATPCDLYSNSKSGTKRSTIQYGRPYRCYRYLLIINPWLWFDVPSIGMLNLTHFAYSIGYLNYFGVRTSSGHDEM